MPVSEDQDRERRLREAAVTRSLGVPPPAEPHSPHPESEPDSQPDPDDDAPRRRMEHQAMWVDRQIRAAMDRGEFDNLPGAGKPLRLPERHDPDWWVKGLIERERITAVLPPALALRREDAGLAAELDREAGEAGVRRAVEEFNRSVVEARRQLLGGPPVVTPTRDVEAEVVAWRARREERRARAAATAAAAAAAQPAEPPGRRLRLRLRRRGRGA